MSDRVTLHFVQSVWNMYDITLSNGGGTFDPISFELLTSGGWAVGQHNGTFRTLTLTPSFGDVCDAVDAVKAAYPHSCIGTWVDTDNARITIDPVGIIPQRKAALASAKALDQDAIYNLDTGITLYVEKDKDK